MLKRLLSSVFLCFALVFGTVSAASGASYTVKYDCDIGTGTMTQGTATGGSLYTPKASQCTPPAGSHFAGWVVYGTSDIRYPEQPFTYNYGTNTVFVAKYHKGKFSVETGQIAANGTFSFTMSAKGTFTVLCGDNGTLSGTGVQVDGETIVRSNTTEATYTCTYPAAGSYIIQFDSTSVTQYSKPSSNYYTGDPSTTTVKSPLGFVNNTNVVAIFGSLSNLFPYVSSTYYPRFVHAFYGCTSLWYIPQDLFGTITTNTSTIYVFYSTFRGCTSLITVPGKLFSSVSVIGSSGFSSTFNNCSNLSEIPEGFFANVSITSTGQTGVFGSTFANCTTIRTIPKDLFAGITDTASGLFYGTFSGCSGLESIPAKLFMSVNPSTTGGAMSLFQGTFKNCTNLIDIEDGLFDGVTRLGTSTFNETFSGCSKLKKIPDLFVNLNNASGSSAFKNTFSGCSMLQFVPEKLFFGVTAGNSNMFEQTFLDCTALTEVPNGMFGNVASGGSSMFKGTFKGCTMLESLPTDLFASINSTSSSHTGMFYETFSGCTSLKAVPSDVFAGIPTGAQNMFYGTFYDCTNLKDIGSDGGGLFRNISNTASTATHMFYQTFYGCSKLLYVPADTFAQIPVGAAYMFYQTFRGCTDLEAIGDGLFKSIQTTTSSDTYMFNQTFYGCSSLSAIPDDTFAGITVGASYMFGDTFYGCSSISAIGPLFENINTTTGATYMFSSTFRGCANVTYVDKFLFKHITDAPTGMFSQTFSGNSSLVNIRADLFSNIQSVASNTFYSTFFGCSSLTGIPVGLFSGITTLNTPNSLFFQTFSGCSSLTEIPDDLFDKITTSAESMFGSTFTNCTGLRSIPETLFRRISVGAKSLFNSTFSGCTGLRSIPDALFANITTGAETMFTRAFYGCTGLTGYVPKKLFRGLIENHVSPSTNMFNHTFTSTGLSTSCGTGMQEAWTGTSEWNTYVSYKTSPWNSSTVKVSCEYVSYTVTYNCGNCTGGSQTPPNSTTVTYNSSFSPASNSGRCIAPNSGYTFAGWAVSNTNPVVYRQPNTSFTWNYTENKTFTATCNPRNVTMNWFGEDGTTPFTPSNSAANQCVYDTSVTIPSNTPSKSGYHFVGWCLDTGLSPYWSEEWDMGYATSGLYWDASHARWEPIVQNGYTMYDEFGSGATSGGLNPGEWGYTFDTSTGKELLGRALCSATPGTHAQSGTPNQNTSGQHCWCAGIKYAESCEIASPSWVYSYNLNTEADCNAECAVQCVSDVYSDIDFGQAIFGVTQ